MIKKLIIESLLHISKESYQKQYSELSKIKSSTELNAFREDNLKKIIMHAYKNVPYYHEIFDQIKLIKGGKFDLSQFNDIPLLTKEIIRKNNYKLVSKDLMNQNYFYNTTGGSTGEPMRFIQDKNYSKWGSATNYYYYKNILKVNEPKTVKKIILWGSEKDIFEGSIGSKARLINWLTNNIFLNTFKMTKLDFQEYIKIINSYKPYLIRGYAGSLYELSNYIYKNNLEIYSPKLIVSAAETLKSHMRNQIENVFHTNVYNFYGTREVSSIAGECNKGLLHIFNFWNYVEILNDKNEPVDVDEEGRVIVTNLFNYSMPFIRYEIGDLAILGPKCSCGSFLPTLKEVTGRITDHFILEDGSIVPAEFFIHLIGVVCNKGLIKKFQVIQKSYNSIEILYIPLNNFNVFEKNSIDDKIRVVMGKNCDIKWKIVDEIPKTKNGKYMYTKTLISR